MSVTTSQQGGGFGSISNNTDRVFYSTTNTVPTTAPTDGIDTHVLLNKDIYEWDGTQWVKQAPIASNYDNDLGLGTDGKIETGFPLHRNTTTTGGYYRHWQNNTSANPALASSGVIYGFNNNLVTGNAWNTANITSIASFVNGYLNTVSGNYSLTSGQTNTNNSAYSIVTGINNVVSGSYNAAFGNANLSNQPYTLTSGVSNTNNGYASFVAGANNINSGTYAGAIGYNNTNQGTANFAAGYVNTINSNYSQTFGANNQVVGGGYTMAQGSNNVTVGSYSFVGGLNNGTVAVPVTGTGTITYGNGHVQSANYSAQFGLVGTMAGNYHIGAGYLTRIAGIYNAAFCYNNNLTASSFGNMVGGYSNTVAGERGVIGGNGNTYAGAYGATFGNSNTTLSGVYGTLVSGTSNQANGGWNSSILGDGNIVDAGGQYTKSVFGYQNRVTTNTHVVFALGQGNTVGSATGLLTNSGAGAIGTGNTVIGAASVAIGQGNSINGGTSYVIGLNYAVTGTNMVGIAGAGQNLGFFGKAPVPRPTVTAAATNNATTQALVNSIRTALINLGLVI
jgi:hypothetical protein